MSIFDDVDGLSPEIKTVLESKLGEAYVPKSEFEAVKNKKDELLTETKKAKEAAKAAQELADKERQEKLASSGDIEALKKFYQDQLDATKGELEGIKTQTKAQQLSALATDFVSSKFIDDAVIRKAVTSEFKSRLDLREGKPVVLDAEGNLTGLSLQDLQNEFLSAQIYKPHIVATKASGGGANGGNGNSGGAAKTMTKAVFDSKNPQEKMDFMRSGGKLI